MEQRDYTIYPEDNRNRYFHGYELNVDVIIKEFKEHGYNVTEQAITHNYNAWLSDHKSGYKDKGNGYFLFSACRCNSLYFWVMPLREGMLDTYIA